MKYELRAMSLGEILDMSIRLMRENFTLLCAITGVVLFPYNLFANLWIPDTRGAGTVSSFSPVFGVLLLVGLLVVMVMGPIANGAVTKAVADRYLDQPTSFGRAYGYVFGRFGKIVGALLRVMVFVFLGFLLVILSMMMSGASALIPQKFLAAMVSAAVNVLYTTFAQVVLVVIYIHARCQREAFDLEFLAKSLTESQPIGETG